MADISEALFILTKHVKLHSVDSVLFKQPRHLRNTDSTCRALRLEIRDVMVEPLGRHAVWVISRGHERFGDFFQVEYAIPHEKGRFELNTLFCPDHLVRVVRIALEPADIRVVTAGSDPEEDFLPFGIKDGLDNLFVSQILRVFSTILTVISGK